METNNNLYFKLIGNKMGTKSENIELEPEAIDCGHISASTASAILFKLCVKSFMYKLTMLLA